jgi:spore maturation protein CgeB
MDRSLNLVFIGLSITSTWGNGHATTYRGLLKYLAAQGHRLTFLERDVPWYAENREFSSAPYCDVLLYGSLAELQELHQQRILDADAVIVGSYVPEGIAVGELVLSTARGLKCFYDIDTPITLTNLRNLQCEYVSPALCEQYDLYLSFTGGPTLKYIEQVLGSPMARALYCSVDPDVYFPEECAETWDMAYLGTYAADRQTHLEELLIAPALENPRLSMAVAGPQYPTEMIWPGNVFRIEHLPASQHRQFYNSQRFTLNLTRRDMVSSGYSPSVRLFEAAACGTPILSDEWSGLETIFNLHTEIFTVRNRMEVTSHLQMPAEKRKSVGLAARKRVLQHHTAAVRAKQLVDHLKDAEDKKARRRSYVPVQLSPTSQ